MAATSRPFDPAILEMNAPREGKAQIDVPLLQVWSKDVPLEQLAAYVDYLPRHEVAFAQSAPTPPSALPRVQVVRIIPKFIFFRSSSYSPHLECCPMSLTCDRRWLMTTSFWW